MSIRDIPRETIIQPTKAAKKNGSLVPFCSCIFQFEQTNGPFSACQALTLLPGIMDALQKPPPPLPFVIINLHRRDKPFGNRWCGVVLPLF